MLTSLVRKEVLGVQADPRSPEHGQYGFLQDLVRHVAYETLSKRERRAKHLPAAEYLSRAFAADEDEVVEVIASHYLAAHEAGPDAEDAAEIKRQGAGNAGARRGARGVARAQPERPDATSSRRQRSLRIRGESGAARQSRRNGQQSRRARRRRARSSRNRSRCTRSRATHTAPPAFSRSSARIDAFTGHRDEAVAADGARVQRHLC